jgi:hypothetical protein
MRRFLLDNDGSNLFFRLTDDVERDVEDAAAECPANVTTYLLCSGAGKFYYPTEVGDVMPIEPLLAAHRKGKDPFDMLLRALRKGGKETLITRRMNDVHDPEQDWNLPRVRKEHPDWVVDAESVKAGKGDWMAYCLDYSRPGVRQEVLASICELVNRYEFDGLQLDWLRFPRHLSGTPEQVWEKRGIITGFTREVRELLDASGRKMLLAARVPASPAGCRHLGMDIAEWTRQGLVDFVVAAPFLTTDFVMPIAELRALMKDRPVPLYAGIEFQHGAQAHCPESLRAAALSLFECGADGIYLFNFPCWEEHIAARPYHWLADLDNPDKAARKPLLFSVSHALHRVPNVDLPGQLPLPVRAGESSELTLRIPEAALPVRRALWLVHSGGDISLSLNGQSLPELPHHRRSELFVEYTGQEAPSEHRPPKEACRVFWAHPSLLRAGANSLTVRNASDRDLEIKRVNLGLW